jgi:hypothetical protein
VKAKSTSDSPTALARHYKNIIAEQSAELARLTDALAAVTRERDAAIEDAREMTTRFDLLNSIACEVVDSYFGVTVDSEAQMFQMMKALRDATVDDGRAPAPPPADTGAGDAALRKLDAQMIGDAVHQARYTIQAMQEDAAEDNYAAAFEHLAVVLVNHNLALDLMQKGETR